MKIDLKAIKFYESMSEETNCFQGKLYINGKYVADVKNNGQGGCTDIYPIDNLTRQITAEAEKYLSHQPKKKCDTYDFEYIRTLESEVDDLFADWLKVKEDNKFIKQMDKGIMYGTKYHYKMTYWKNTTLTACLRNPAMQGRIKQIIKDLIDKGETILNTNIPKEFYPN